MKCVVCGKTPNELHEYIAGAEAEGYSDAEEYVIREEGTYNSKEDIFCCTECYTNIGMPLGKAIKQWTLYK